MDITKNNFMVFLVLEITRKFHCKYEDAYKEVKNFSLTADFDNSFKKWKKRELKNNSIRKNMEYNAFKGCL